MKVWNLIAILLITCSVAAGQNFKLAVLKYNGGGDWYANLTTSVPNLIQFCNKELKTEINAEQEVVEVGSKELFKYAFVHMTGHGNVVFSDNDIINLDKGMYNTLFAKCKLVHKQDTKT